MPNIKRKDKLQKDVFDYMGLHSPCTASGVADSLRPSYKGKLSSREVASILSVMEKDGLMESEPGMKPKVYSIVQGATA